MWSKNVCVLLLSLKEEHAGFAETSCHPYAPTILQAAEVSMPAVLNVVPAPARFGLQTNVHGIFQLRTSLSRRQRPKDAV
jgi:hypothetical protein